MEHSKLPWVSDNWGSNCITLREEGVSEYIAQFDVANNKDRNLANAAFIVTACNEHDTLKAKADLFEDLIENCQDHFNHGGKIVDMMVLIDRAGIRAKELK